MLQSIYRPQACELQWAIVQQRLSTVSWEQLTGNQGGVFHRLDAILKLIARNGIQEGDAVAATVSKCVRCHFYVPFPLQPLLTAMPLWFFGWKERCNKKEWDLEKGWALVPSLSTVHFTSFQLSNTESSIYTYLLA
jgi:hypothetical protein